MTGMKHALGYDFDVIVVGGGHAGIEAAYAAAKMGSKTLMITLDIEKIGLMPCNPAIGGVGKGHIVYEISALGGLMPKLCTKTYLQARMLNTKKGAAVQGLRLQIDKYAYNALSKSVLQNTENLTLLSGVVDDIILDNSSRVCGVITAAGQKISAPTVVITTGTFLNGKIHIGEKNFAAGRQDEQAVAGLSFFLEKHGIRLGRLKTGTPPRLDRASIDFSKMEFQEPDNLSYLFEFKPHDVVNSHPCYITHTNKETHAVIKRNLHLSAMYNGNIQGIGPRYCPSIEDKIGRFPNKESHHVFVEPEGANTNEIYPNGISTSLPYEVQKEYVQTIAGFEQAVIVRPGYAVEYDFVLPNQLRHTLEVKSLEGLFLAGQINGTTGYEEAAGQGIIAGINAHLKHTQQPPFIMDRTEGYIGVMIDDLVTLGVDEPYRMFTSRAERRLLLRQDNAFLRLTEKAYALGLIDEELYQIFKQEKMIIHDTLNVLRAGHNNAQLLKLFGTIECNEEALRAHAPVDLSARAVKAIHAEIVYQPYIEREQKEVEKNNQYKQMIIPDDFDYADMPGLSKELQQKLKKHKPQTIAQAALIPGITPAALSLLIFKVRVATDNIRKRKEVGCSSDTVF
jgi:tRNA uridine 5-carboxymethylaminomethyl modification enzyme